MTIYLSGVVRPDLPAMVTPRMGTLPPRGQLWAADTGMFSAPQNFTLAKYLAWLNKLAADYAETNLFATAPDKVGDAAATLAMARPAAPYIRDVGYRVALVAQDGLIVDDVPWDEFDALFIGGTTTWKLSAAAESLCREAKRRGKWVHMGRVNSWRRMEHARAIGCDSVDGTVLKHDPQRPVGSWTARAEREPHVWDER